MAAGVPLTACLRRLFLGKTQTRDQSKLPHLAA
jgi:hypothetical protein